MATAPTTAMDLCSVVLHTPASCEPSLSPASPSLANVADRQVVRRRRQGSTLFSPPVHSWKYRKQLKVCDGGVCACMQLVYVQSCEMSFCHSSGAGSKVDSGDSKKQNNDLSIPAAIAVSVVVIILLATLIVVLVVIVCYCKKCRRSKQYGVHNQSASSSSPPSYHSSKGSLDGPVIATPDLSRKAKVAMELKPLEFGAPFSEDDGEMIPSGAIPVNMFREHVEKFDENRQLLFQHEFDVSDVIITS